VRYPSYQSYIPSGVEYLGDVPQHWEVKRSRFCIRVNPLSDRLRQLGPDDEVSFIPMEAVGEYGGLNLESTKRLSEVGSSYTEFQDGDVVVAKITPCFENGKGALVDSLMNGAALGTTELDVLRVRFGLERRFLFYLTISSAYRKTGEAEMYGAGGQKRVPPEFNKDFRVPLPPSAEQHAIADFLDRKTMKLDLLVAKRHELIEKLQEKRTALISRTVTRGLNPNAKLKPSGIEWLGDIPESWRVKRLKYLCKVQTGDKDTVDAVEGGSYPFFVRSQTVERINSFTFNCEAVLTAGDGVGVGKVFHHYVGPFDFHQRVYMLNNFRDVSGYFLFLVLKEHFHKVALEGNAKSTVDSLRMPLFLDFEVPLPPFSEQGVITEYLDREMTKIDRMVVKVEEAIDRLQEYRIALITAAVTGKIDVREGLTEVDR